MSGWEILAVVAVIYYLANNMQINSTTKNILVLSKLKLILFCQKI